MTESVVVADIPKETKVYKFGLQPPTENADLVREQFASAHWFRNQLVEIEQNYRAVYRQLTAHLPEVLALAQAEALTAELAGQLRLARQENARALPEELKAAYSDAKFAEKQARAAASAARRKHLEPPEQKAFLKVLYERRKVLMKAAYLASGITWGTRALAMEAHEKSCKTTPMHSDPRFTQLTMRRHRFGVTSPGAEGPSFHQVLEPRTFPGVLQEPACLHQRPGVKWDRRRKTLLVRVGSDGRKPVFAAFPMRMHRPLREGAQIVQVEVCMHVEGPHYHRFRKERWEVNITVRQPIEEPRHGVGIVAINLGWRTRNKVEPHVDLTRKGQVVTSGLRVATTVDQNGTSREFILPSRILSAFDHADSLRSIRDRLLNQMRSVIVGWFAYEAMERTGAAPGSRILPPEFGDLQHMHAWKSTHRWYRLFLAWRASEDPKWKPSDPHPPYLAADSLGDRDVTVQEAYQILCSWYHKDVHLWQWEVGERRKTSAARQYLYRCWAKELAEQHDTLLIHTTGLEQIAKLPAVTDEEWDLSAARHTRVRAAVSELETSLIQAFTSAGGSVYRFPGKLNTCHCHACGKRCAINAASQLEYRCEHCGVRWDQDENHCQNLWHRYRETPDQAKVFAPPKVGVTVKSRWDKTREKKSA